MQVTLYNVNSGDYMLRYWGSVAARNAYFSQYETPGNYIRYDCNMLFPADHAIVDIPDGIEPTYAIYDDGTTSRCYHITRCDYVAIGSLRAELLLDAWGTYYGINAANLSKLAELHVTAGNGFNAGSGIVRPIVESVLPQSPMPEPVAGDNIFPSVEFCIITICSTPVGYRTLVTAKPKAPQTEDEFFLSRTDAITRAIAIGGINEYRYPGDGTPPELQSINVTPIQSFIVPRELFPDWTTFKQFAGGDGIGMIGETVAAVGVYSVSAYPTATQWHTEPCLQGDYTYTLRRYIGRKAVAKIGTHMVTFDDTGAAPVLGFRSCLTNNGFQIFCLNGTTWEDITDVFTCPIVTDTAQSYFAQNRTSFGIQMLASGASIAGSLVAQNPVGVVGGALTMASQIGNMAAKLKEPASCKGDPFGLFAVAEGCRAYYITAENQNDIISATNRYGYYVDKVVAGTLLSSPPVVEIIDSNGNINGTKTATRRYVQIDRVRTHNVPGYLLPATDRLIAMFASGVYINYA